MRVIFAERPRLRAICSWREPCSHAKLLALRRIEQARVVKSCGSTICLVNLTAFALSTASLPFAVRPRGCGGRARTETNRPFSACNTFSDFEERTLDGGRGSGREPEGCSTTPKPHPKTHRFAGEAKRTHGDTMHAHARAQTTITVQVFAVRVVRTAVASGAVLRLLSVLLCPPLGCVSRRWCVRLLPIRPGCSPLKV